MIDPHPPPGSTAKDDWLRILPEILKFRLILHMVKDDWPPPSLTAQNLPEF